MRGETTSPTLSLEGLNYEADQFFKLLEDANKELYLVCARFTKLIFIVLLYYLKWLLGWSNKSLNLLFAFLKDKLSNGERLP